MAHSLSQNASQAAHLASYVRYGLGVKEYFDFTRKIERVSREDVRRVARKYLRLDAYALFMLRPPN